jgi:hypothetical protein
MVTAFLEWIDESLSTQLELWNKFGQDRQKTKETVTLQHPNSSSYHNRKCACVG